jgi:hypothetical protein
MKANDSEKTTLQDNLKQAVKECPKLKINNRQLTSSFKISPRTFLDFTDDKYEDGLHSYRMDTSIKTIAKNGEEHEEKCEIHFDAHIKGTDVEIVNEMVIGENFFIPSGWNL